MSDRRSDTLVKYIAYNYMCALPKRETIFTIGFDREHNLYSYVKYFPICLEMTSEIIISYGTHWEEHGVHCIFGMNHGLTENIHGNLSKQKDKE